MLQDAASPSPASEAARSGTVSAATETVVSRLPVLIDRALAAYDAAVHLDVANDPKAVATYQAACRASLDHLKSLLLLAQSLEGMPGDGDRDRELEALISSAAEAIAAIGESPATQDR
ncbi:MAG: hypothetical protein EA405_07880 [Rhodospirillales bacterium]|nr:MAG: hypothetical protein EA405_07880 [Rhodospirillales bacterium]